jgi:CRISPR-associated endoribonuclease Cas6
MRIKINLEPIGERLTLPSHYNYILQAFIYRNLSKTLAEKVHSQGFAFEKRQFRLFTFSRLLGSFQRNQDTIFYQNTISLWVASPLTEILESFASHLARKGKIKLGTSYCRITGIEVPFKEEYDNSVTVKMLSPVTAYSTLLTLDKKRKTYYYSPFEEDFKRICHQNLLKKYQILNNKALDSNINFSIIPERVSKRNEHIIMYKGTVIKAWSGIYRLEGSPELIKVAFDCGLGAKNSQGFGMIEKYIPKV